MARTQDVGKGSRFFLLASVCLVIVALYFGREVLIPLALAVLLSFLFTPVVHWLERLGMGRVLASLLVVCVAVSVIGFAGYLVYNQAKSLVSDLPNYREQLASKFGAFKSHGNFFRKAENEIKAIDKTATQQAATQQSKDKQSQTQPTTTATAGTQPPRDGASGEPAPASPSGAQNPSNPPTVENPLPVRVIPQTTPLETLREYGASILDPLATAGLVLVFMIFMLIQREDLRDRMIRLVGHGRLNITTQAFDEAGTRISKYLSALAVVNGAYGIIVAVGLWVIGHFLGKGHGFPSVLTFGILVGLFRFVPYIGIWIGAAFPLALSIALFSGYAPFLATIGLLLVMEIVISQFVEPFWYGASTGMSALAVLVAAVFWTWLWGPVGLLLSTPLTVCLVVMGKYVPQLEFIDILLREEPVLEPPVRVYQRLIAEDPEEATELSIQYLEEKTLEEVYDQILIPALALAERDSHHGRLEPDRLPAVFQGMKEIVEELGDRQRAARIREKASVTEEVARQGETAAKSERNDRRLPMLPTGCSINILCLPARADADEIVATMLAQLLELRGYCTTTATANSLASEMVGMVATKKADLVCVSAMPPAAIAHARYLCKRLHGQHENLRMVVGVWHFKGDLKKAKDRISCDESVPIVTTLAEAQNQIEELTHPLIANSSNAAGEQDHSESQPAVAK